jgi:Caspase domain
VTFTAYAFNEDRVKSATATDDSYSVPADISPRTPRAYVITVGVNEYEDPKRRLSFAVADAKEMAASLQEIEGYEVVSISLISDYARDGAAAVDQATKANIQAVLSLLAGDDSERERLRRELGMDVDKLAKSTPDDLVILTFSGHGHTEQGRFYLLPSDSGKDRITDAVLPKLISSEELTGSRCRAPPARQETSDDRGKPTPREDPLGRGCHLAGRRRPDQAPGHIGCG